MFKPVTNDEITGILDANITSRTLDIYGLLRQFANCHHALTVTLPRASIFELMVRIKIKVC